jgi:hypothetical protein
MAPLLFPQKRLSRGSHRGIIHHNRFRQGVVLLKGRNVSRGQPVDRPLILLVGLYLGIILARPNAFHADCVAVGSRVL